MLTTTQPSNGNPNDPSATTRDSDGSDHDPSGTTQRPSDNPDALVATTRPSAVPRSIQAAAATTLIGNPLRPGGGRHDFDRQPHLSGRRPP